MVIGDSDKEDEEDEENVMNSHYLDMFVYHHSIDNLLCINTSRRKENNRLFRRREEFVFT